MSRREYVTVTDREPPLVVVADVEPELVDDAPPPPPPPTPRRRSSRGLGLLALAILIAATGEQ